MMLQLLACALAIQATPPDQVTFDAASVKPAPAEGAGGAKGDFGAVKKKGSGGGVGLPGGGPGTSDPGRFRYPRISLSALLRRAFDVQFEDQLQGPGWLNSEMFAVEATMPADTTMEQFRLMLQNLLKERFKLAVHRKAKEFPGYALVVGKNGPKLSAGLPDSSPDPYGLPKTLRAQTAGRTGQFFAGGPRGFRIFFQQQTMHDLASFLQGHLNRSVTDETNLPSKYDFILTFLPDGLPTPPGAEKPPDIVAAVQEQLRLKLDSKKVPVQVVVVDHAEKAPTRN
jgi:uncharacterized protein (TIGR03435 family)